MQPVSTLQVVALVPPSCGLLWALKWLALWLAADSAAGGVLVVRRELAAWAAAKLEDLLLVSSGVFHLATFFIIFELRTEIAWAFGLWLRACRLLAARLVLLQVDCLAACSGIAEAGTSVTCQPMALVAAGGGGPLEGSFLVIRNAVSTAWDEVWVGAQVGNSDLVCRTTTSDGSAWVWCLVKLIDLNQMKFPLVAGRPAARAEPVGLAVNSVNWICAPGAIGQQWSPQPHEQLALLQEARLIAMRSGQVPLPDISCYTIPGQTGIIPYDMGVVQPGPAVPGGAALGVAPVAVAGALGPGMGGSPAQLNMDSL